MVGPIPSLQSEGKGLPIAGSLPPLPLTRTTPMFLIHESDVAAAQADAAETDSLSGVGGFGLVEDEDCEDEYGEPCPSCGFWPDPLYA
jgi:hypothetical protein